jgi:alginate O-acetyltransferase complex protein AlgI
VDAWTVAICFTLQIYFDFSGYSDMAVGLAQLFNIRIPNNFNSPYQATSIVDFWNRWHITLTRFVTSYLYTPLIRSFKHLSLPKVLVATILTMVLVGLWHGPAWTFAAFGAIHGLALALNRLFRNQRWRLPDPLGWLLTFLTINVGFVFFRSDSMGQAFDLLKGMAGVRGIILSHRFAAYVHRLLGPVPVHADYWHVRGQGYVMVALPVLLLFMFLKHNSLREYESFQPTRPRMVVLALLLFFGLLDLHTYAPFIYVNF